MKKLTIGVQASTTAEYYITSGEVPGWKLDNQVLPDLASARALAGAGRGWSPHRHTDQPGLAPNRAVSRGRRPVQDAGEEYAPSTARATARRPFDPVIQGLIDDGSINAPSPSTRRRSVDGPSRRTAPESRCPKRSRRPIRHQASGLVLTYRKASTIALLFPAGAGHVAICSPVAPREGEIETARHEGERARDWSWYAVGIGLSVYRCLPGGCSSRMTCRSPGLLRCSNLTDGLRSRC